MDIPLQSWKAVRLINPLAFLGTEDEPQVLPMAATSCHVLADRMFLSLPDEDVNELPENCISFLRTLRLVTKQAALPKDVIAITFSTPESIPAFVFPDARKANGTFFGRYRLETAVTPDRIKEADTIGLSPNISVCYEIILDALHAYEQHDYREAILFAAIAIEALARTLLEAEYQRVISAAKPPPHTNVLSFPQAGGKTIKKDPIYALLVDGDNFSRLLHEVPLYLLRRSMLSENQELYRRLVNLYRTRNRLSHGQLVDAQDGDLFPVDRKGSLQSLSTAIDAFAWFGETGYFLPTLDPVPFGDEAAGQKKRT